MILQYVLPSFVFAISFACFCNKFLLDFCCKYLCIFSVSIYAFCVRQYFWRDFLKPSFKIDVVIMIICSIVIIINSVLTLQVSTASLPHDCGPCAIKVAFIHT